MTDWLDIIDAAYDLEEPSNEAWLRRLINACGPALGGMGEPAGALVYFPKGAPLQLLPPVADTPFTLAFVGAMYDALQREPHHVASMCDGPPFTTLTVRNGKRAIAQSPVMRESFHPLGVRDLVNVLARDPGPWGININMCLPAERTVAKRAASLWARLAAHMHAGLRLRFAKYGTPSVAGLVTKRPTLYAAGMDAVLSDTGKVEHAEGEAVDARGLLRQAAIDITRARTKTRASNPDDALVQWQALVDGRWSLTDHFDSDGRRFLVARRNGPTEIARAALSQRERQVAGFRAMGHSLKLIGYELGLPPTTVARALSSAAHKLGFGSAQEFALLFASSDAAVD